MKISTRHLQVFDAVARFGSVTSAAGNLGMSQGVASAALRDFQMILRSIASCWITLALPLRYPEVSVSIGWVVALPMGEEP